jgi:D-alanyl-lipoteichoic acid acyltransferase DltB (MBOAT superfamily)
MSFTANSFIFCFLPLAAAIFNAAVCLRKENLAKAALIAASFYFYFKVSESAAATAIFCALITVNYFFCAALSKTQSEVARDFIFALALFQNAGLLVFLKYAKTFFKIFFFVDFNAPTISFILGVSYFSFRFISCAADSYRKKIKIQSFLDFVLYASFFPVIVMGPIIKFLDFKPVSKFKWENIYKAFVIFSFGFAKKNMLANPLTGYASKAFAADSTSLTLALALVANFFAFYFDFSGYSDMARGVALFFNIEIKENFDSPYKARNIQEFWKKWHISLTRFLNEYIFGSIYKLGASVYVFCFATMATFIISGLWHGASANFILWGAAHGAAVCVVAVLAVVSGKKRLLSKFAARAVTVAFLIFAGSITAVSGLRNYLKLLKSLFALSGSRYDLNFYIIFLIIVSAVICFCGKNTKELTKKISPQVLALAAALFVISIFAGSEVSGFIYQAY